MQTHEIRKRFLDHFVKAGHTEVPSASVILDDPNLLFVNAGMVQFVPVLPWPADAAVEPRDERAEVHPDAGHRRGRHHHPAQHLLPDGGQLLVRRLLQEGRHRVRVDPADQSARTRAATDSIPKGSGPPSISMTTRPSNCGRKSQDCRSERIQRRGMADNYWSMGIPGPCGPSSEIYVRPRTRVRNRRRPRGQRGPLHRDLESRLHAERARRGHQQVGLRDPRAVAAQEHRHRHGRRAGGVPAAGRRQRLRDRPAATGHRPGRRNRPARLRRGNHDDDVRYRIIADHSRTAAIIIGDGVSPGNDGRGYVLRRLLRRVIRSAKLLGIDTPIVGELMVTVRDAMGPSYPELVTDFDRIQRIAVAEETAFNRTLVAGSRLFEDAANVDEVLWHHGAVGHRRVHPARHLRLPDRADPGDGGRDRAERRRGGLPRPDGRAAPARQGRRRRAQARPRRPHRLPRTGRRGPDGVHRLRRAHFRGKDSRHLRRRQARSRRRARWRERWTASS